MVELAIGKIVHVIAGLDSADGGPPYSVPRLCAALAEAEVDTVLLSVAGRGAAAREQTDKGYLDRRFRWDHAKVPMLKALRRSSGLAQALGTEAAEVGVIHNHGLWLLPNIYSGWAATRARVPLIVSPRGMLSPVALSFSPLKKQIFWRLLQGPVVLHAACLHATSEQEYQEIRAFGLINPVAVIPNGIDVPLVSPKLNLHNDVAKIVLSLGRIHPKKGLDRLVRAWAAIEPAYPDWQLRVVGPAEGGHDAELRALATSLGLRRLTIEGPVYGDEKHDVYRAAELFVLPTLNENFGMTVAEALAAGTPVIVSKGAPWRGLDEEGCGWWIDHGVEPLAVALSRAMSLPRQQLEAMGVRGRAWMVRDFSWECVANDMLTVYRWLAQGGECPDAVRIT